MIMKREYIKPGIIPQSLTNESLLASTGPGANDQSNPTVGGGGGSRYFDAWDNSEEEDDWNEE